MVPRKGKKPADDVTVRKDASAQSPLPKAAGRLDDAAWQGPAYNLVQRVGYVNGTLYGVDAIEYAKANNGRVMRRDLLGLETLRDFAPEDARRMYEKGDDALHRFSWYLDLLVTKLLLPTRFYMKSRPGRVGQSMPWDRAMMYVTDGTMYGILYDTGMIEWTGDSLQHAFGPELHE